MDLGARPDNLTGCWAKWQEQSFDYIGENEYGLRRTQSAKKIYKNS